MEKISKRGGLKYSVVGRYELTVMMMMLWRISDCEVSLDLSFCSSDNSITIGSSRVLVFSLKYRYDLVKN